MVISDGQLVNATGRNDFGPLAATAVAAILATNASDGLPPFLLDPTTGEAAAGAAVSLGARGDSYVEYLLKAWIAGGKSDTALLE